MRTKRFSLLTHSERSPVVITNALWPCFLGQRHTYLTQAGRQTGPADDSRLEVKGLNMSKISLGAHPYLLGFDQLERLAERAAKGAEGYPPYNIEHVAPDGFRITLAVAGFSDDDLTVTIEDRQLVVRGRIAEPDEERVFLHRGIAGRAFQRSFVLADGVEVVSANMENGLLHIDLRRTAPQQVVQTIPISRK